MFLLHVTECEAQLAIAADIMEKIHQFQVEKRDFEDTIAMEDYIEPTSVRIDATFCDSEGKSYRLSEVLNACESEK